MSEIDKRQEQDKKAQLLQNQYNQYQETLTEVQTQLSTISSQIEEHQIVDKTLVAIPPSERSNRKCFKMVGGVLVEKTVDEVIRLLDQDLKSLATSKTKLESEVVRVRKEMESWMKEKNVKIVRQ
ncbi:prefoldin subunit 2 [[Candida] railenensis]|uniref:Prefoldin subunit 2 n=1 Tax=[Candida] railenensis TaxID=45579 RepID=A0A9P0VWX4_9ASCO|nr:prefoldin subunit 2 [[Candida] railenensis]